MSAGKTRDEDGFLARWSRRKLAAEETAAPAAPAPEPAAAPQDSAAPATEEPEVPLEELPPLEQIGPDFDIRPWLKRRLPAAWRQAALRRVWVTDPAIRDFKGLADYDWDFNTPGALPGFGPLRPGPDVGSLLDQALGRTPAPAAPKQAAAVAAVEPPEPGERPPGEAADPVATGDSSLAGESKAEKTSEDTTDIDNQSQKDLPATSRAGDLDGQVADKDDLTLPYFAENDSKEQDRSTHKRRGGAATPR